jgi:hypothetical protein
MKNTFDELLAGWAKAIDEIGLPEEYRQQVAVVNYSGKQCYKLEDYSPGFFPPGNELLEEVPADAMLSYAEYGLQANGLPCYCRTITKEGLPISTGFYRYTPEAVEFVQYNLANGVPHIFQRMVLAEGRKQAFLHAVANGGGTRFSGLTPKQAFDVAKGEKHSIFLYVQRYEYEEGRIVRDVSTIRAPGAGEYGFSGIYSYGADGKLMEIRDHSKSGVERLRYVYWDESEGLEGLAARLAGEMAEAIVAALLEAKVGVPLALLQLSYHYADDYLPSLNPLSVKEKDDAIKKNGIIWEDLFLNDDWLDNVSLKGIEKTFTQFMNQVNHRGAHDTARGMLQKTSALLTASRLKGCIPVDAGFFAYAIDHSVEGHDAEDFKAILLNCGMPEEQYEKWREWGWVRE